MPIATDRLEIYLSIRKPARREILRGKAEAKAEAEAEAAAEAEAEERSTGRTTTGAARVVGDAMLLFLVERDCARKT